ncbi:hypothetical protein BYT27DRAFT_7222526 [Phlegmacium glaucopus]|nr:hypothetical protein BYT27DRAFT_7222526 [Phlegmacium glaucopus]
MPALPQELIDAILNHVNDRQTLKACSLVASSFVPQSQRHLFHTIDLDALTPRKKAYTRFVRLLTLNPLLGTYVRSLRLGDDSDEFGSYRSWLIHAKNLPQLFQHLTRLEAFSLTFNDSDEMDWKSIPAEIRSALGRLFRLPTLQAVSLEFIRGFPIHLLLGLTLLKQLSLSCVDVDSNDVVVHSHSVSELRELHLRGTPPPTIAAISHCLSQSSSTLRRLAITPTLESGFCSAVSDLMIAVGSNITHFEWLPSIHFSPSSVPIDISQLPHLRHLKFIISFRKFHLRDHFDEMLHILGPISTDINNKIEIIELECNLMRWLDNKSLKAQWRPLEKVLDKDGFRNKLKEIRVGLSVSTNVPSDRSRMVTGFSTDLFASLRKRGVVISVQDQGRTNDRFLDFV